MSPYMWRKSDEEDDLLRVPTKEDVDRMARVWAAFSGVDPTKIDASFYMGFPARDRMEIWVAEHRMRAERLATARLTSATRWLVLLTFVLAFATIALVLVTVYGH